MTKYLYLLSALMLALAGCKSEDATNVSLEDVKFIKDFPYNEELKELPDKVDEIGILGVRVVGDSLIALGHNDSWSLHSIDGKTNYGHFLSIGQGPDEFLYFLPSVGKGAFNVANDSLWAYIPDQYNARIAAINLTEFICSGQQKLRSNKSRFLEGDTKWGVVSCGENSYHMLDPYGDYRGLRRMLVVGDSLTEIPNTQVLSDHTVKESGEDLNLLSAVVRYSPETEKFVEAMVFFNQLNVYSSDGNSATTICVGNKLHDLNKIENTPKYERHRTYNNVTTNKLGFGAIYSGHTMDPAGPQDTEMQFFNWDYEPIYRFKLPYDAFAAELDITHKKLWVIDKNDDALRCYDATPIIEAYKK